MTDYTAADRDVAPLVAIGARSRRDLTQRQRSTAHPRWLSFLCRRHSGRTDPRLRGNDVTWAGELIPSKAGIHAAQTEQECPRRRPPGHDALHGLRGCKSRPET